MTAPDVTALRAAVCAAPDDLLPRRRYADAVRADDPDRARLIDVQLRLREAARAGAAEPDADDEDAAHALVRAHGDAWRGPIGSAVTRSWFWGGFVEEVRVPADRLAESWALLRGFAPVRMLQLTGLRGRVADVLRVPVFAQLVSLDVGENDLDDADVIALAADPALAGLQVLRVAGNPKLGLPALRALAPLRSLRFVDAGDTDAPLRIEIRDWESSRVDVDFTHAQELLEHELGALPWLRALDRPSNNEL